MEPQNRPLNEYPLGELQEVLDYIYDKYKSAKTKVDKEKFKDSYQAVASHYNKRAGSKIYILNI